MLSTNLALLYARTVVHIDGRQVLSRLLSPLKRKVGVVAARGEVRGRPNPISPAVAFPFHDPWNTREELQDSRMRFIGRADVFDDWVADGAPVLWQFYLHYFHYLHLLEREDQRTWCHHWIDHNPPCDGVGWHPYPTSLRIINWVKSGLAESDTKIADSLIRQARYLRYTLERHLGGNHLLENARALLYYACQFSETQDGRVCRELSLRLFDEELHRQVLGDGGHYERSMMYHGIVLEGLLDLLNLLHDDGRVVQRFRGLAHRMLNIYASSLHPDGGIVLFNDAGLEIALPSAKLFSYAEDVVGLRPKTSAVFRDTGYYFYRNDDLFIAIDAGPIGPDELPAHAHADIFSFEMSLGSKRFIVDSGVFDYEAGPMREYNRSTRAHNTVEIDSTDQVECWSTFRVARRQRPQGVVFNSNDRGFSFEGTFNGYRQLLGDGLCHTRRLDLIGDRLLIVDHIAGVGRHQVVSRLHFHPDVQVRRLSDASVELVRGSDRCLLSSVGSDLAIETGWYCPEFGKKIPIAVVSAKYDGVLPASLKLELDLAP